MKQTIRKYLILTLGLAALAGAGCSKQEGTTAAAGGGGGGAGGKKLKLAFVTNNASDFWTIARAGTTKAAEDMPNISVEFKIPEDGTAATQTRILDDLLAKGIDGVAISPVDPANETLKLNEVAKQAMLVTHDSDAPKSDRQCYVGTDNVAAGRMAGETIKKALPNGGKLMAFVGSLDAQNAHDRFAGIKEALQGSNVEFIDCRTDDTDRVRAKANVLDTIVKYPEVSCLVGLWSYNGPAILNAIKDSNKVGAIKVVCFDEEDETLQGVRDGAIFATIVQQPYEFGYQAMKVMNSALNGDKSMIPANKQIIVPTLVIDKGSVEDFSTKLKKLRGR
jgi:ribose transport system substrate-binding protein